MTVWDFQLEDFYCYLLYESGKNKPITIDDWSLHDDVKQITLGPLFFMLSSFYLSQYFHVIW